MHIGIRHTIMAAMITIGPVLGHAQENINEGWTFWSNTHFSERTTVSLPHDAMQTEERSPDAPGGHANGYFPGNVYHYERQINIPSEWLDKHLTLRFGGVYRRSTVWVNGRKAGGAANGYIPFSVEIDSLVHEGRNTIRVDVDNSAQPDSRWYSGAGIYRPVEISVQNQTHIGNVRITTLSVAPTLVEVKAWHNGGQLSLSILNGEEMVWEQDAEGHSPLSTFTFPLDNARLWSADSPCLYTLVLRLMVDGRILETRRIPFGIRQLSWDSTGLRVNGEQVLLRGGCLHHDNGILGAREFDEAALRRVKRLKEYGFNALRMAHNPASDALLRACDSLGMYVIDELWDMWYQGKNEHDYAEDFRDNYRKDMQTLTERDYNHPCVVMYSIGNEVSEPSEERGMALAKKLVGEMHRLDDSRPVTAGINLSILAKAIPQPQHSEQQSQNGQSSADIARQQFGSEQYNQLVMMVGGGMQEATKSPAIDSIASPVLDLLDIAGYNYAAPRYPLEGELHPHRVIYGSETMCYDLSQNWQMVEQLPYVVGDFMWTAWDYIGETGVGTWYYADEQPSFVKPFPWLLAGTGALDIIGNPTGEALLAKAVWSTDASPYIGVCPIHDSPLVKAPWRGYNSIPSWSWRGSEGKQTKVEVFTRAERVRFYLNDTLLGEVPVIDNVAIFPIAYCPGILRVVSVDKKGNEYESELCSAKGPLQISILPEKCCYKRGEIMFLDICITDSLGTIESCCDTQLRVTVEGGQLLAFGSAQPKSEERFETGSYTTYYGRSLAVVRPTDRHEVKIRVQGGGMIAEKIVSLQAK